MIALFADNLFPVLLVTAAGFALAALLRLDPRPLADITFYVLAPCLIFRLIVDSGMSGAAFGRMALFATATLGTVAAVAWGVGRLARWSRPTVAALVLVSLLPNAGNFGLSANLFAFGEPGLAHAGVFFVVSSILTFTVGVFIASLGRTSLVRAAAGLPRVPALWAVVAAFALTLSGLAAPRPLDRAIDLLADACIPVFLILLGMELYGRGRGPLSAPLVCGVLLRLVGGAAVAYGVAEAIGLEGTARSVGILQASMPSAVITIVLAVKYDVEPRLVTGVVFATTVLCPLTLTPLMRLLGAGI